MQTGAKPDNARSTVEAPPAVTEPQSPDEVHRPPPNEGTAQENMPNEADSLHEGIAQHTVPTEAGPLHSHHSPDATPSKQPPIEQQQATDEQSSAPRPEVERRQKTGEELFEQLKKAQVEKATQQVDKSRSYYRLVGECYVHGMMNGEAIKLQNDNGIQPQTFELR